MIKKGMKNLFFYYLGVIAIASFSLCFIPALASADVIIDNRDSQTSKTGTWPVSGGANPYDLDSLYSRDGTNFTFHFNPPQSGIYEMSMWWTEWSSRSSNVPVDIEYSDGVATVYVDQQVNGGQWNVQGQYYFESGTTYDITITSQPGPSSTCADAVRFQLISSTTSIIDNRDSQISKTGTWPVSGGANPYGIDSFYSRDGTTFTWHFTPQQSGVYEVSMWWTEWSSRSSNVPVDIEYSDGVATVYVDQQVNGGQWNVQGQYYFESGTTYDITITSQPGPSSTCADAIRFVLGTTSTHTITAAAGANGTITPSGNVTVNEGDDKMFNLSPAVGYNIADVLVDNSSVGAVASYTFTNVTADHTIAASFEPGTIPTTSIIDNRDSQISKTGTWPVSGGANPYGIDSFYSRDGTTFTWHFTPQQSGVYEVSMWWTEWTSRSSSVPVDIEYSDGVATVYVDQQVNGGQWNSQGQFYFESGTTYDITITSQPGPSSTCADAIKFSFISNDSFVEILEPSSYYLQTSPDLTVSAVAVNLEPAWKIKFTIDLGTPDERSIIDTSEPYEVLFTSLTQREHTVDVFVVDGLNSEVPGTYTHDQIIQIGIGHYYVAIGDSITEGFGDDDPSDDISLDGRNSGPGYESILNNLLTIASSGIPHTIDNEGVGGATSSDGRESILTILAKHSESQRFFVQFGTNDARPWLPVPSGKGLSPNDPGYPGTFKDNMQHIIDEINSEEKEVCLGKPPITLGDSTYSTPYDNPDEGARSVLIKEYNEVIDELKNDLQNNIMVTPPDFYSLFNEDISGGKRYDFEYADNLHPNGVGYHSMANHWLESLTP